MLEVPSQLCGMNSVTRWSTAEDCWWQQRQRVDITEDYQEKWLLLHCMKAKREKPTVNREFQKFHLWHLQPPVCCDYQTNFFTKKSINLVLIFQTDERFCHNSWETQKYLKQLRDFKGAKWECQSSSFFRLKFTRTLWVFHLMQNECRKVITLNILSKMLLNRIRQEGNQIACSLHPELTEVRF